ncbi:MAG: CgeB family protein [Gammaproteobacteria bacterium]
MSLNILYLGHDYGTSRHRADVLRRLGHRVELIDPWAFLTQQPFIKKVIGKLTYEIGTVWMEPYVSRRLLGAIEGKRFDVIWSDQCNLIGPNTALVLKEHGRWFLSYAVDDPFGPRDKKRFSLFRKSIMHFDLMAVVRRQNVEEAYALGVPKVVLVLRSADEIAHAPLDLPPEEKARWASEVAFIGTWMPERGPFMSRLVQLGVPLTLYGDRWQKAPEWRVIKEIWRGPGLVGPDYVKSIQSAKICLGLISKGNRDLHTQRSAEIPYIGSVLCAERTEEHLYMYQENEEAVFWSTPEKCAEKCFALLADEKKRKRIAKAGRRRCINSGYLNEPVVRRILDALLDGNSGMTEKPGLKTATVR